MSAIVHALATLVRASYDIEEINEDTREHWREAANSANTEHKQLERQIRELQEQNNKLLTWQAAHTLSDVAQAELSEEEREFLVGVLREYSERMQPLAKRCSPQANELAEQLVRCAENLVLRLSRDWTSYGPSPLERLWRLHHSARIEGARLMQEKALKQAYGERLDDGMTLMPTRSEVMDRIRALKPEDVVTAEQNKETYESQAGSEKAES